MTGQVMSLCGIQKTSIQSVHGSETTEECRGVTVSHLTISKMSERSVEETVYLLLLLRECRCLRSVVLLVLQTGSGFR